MAMFIPTREEQVPGNKDSDFRKDVLLVWSHRYYAQGVKIVHARPNHAARVHEPA
jgi:hypothetical protein